MERDLLKNGLAALGLEPMPEAVLDKLLDYLSELRRWNKHHNLTAISDPSEGVEKHLLDSLTLLPLLEGAESLLDIGSGAGLPGLILKLALPELQLLSIDGVAKKISFQRHIIRRFGLTAARAEAWRIEELAAKAEYARAFDTIVFRALGSLEKFVPLALPCLAENGRFLLMKGPEGRDELRSAAQLLEHCRLQGRVCHELQLPLSGAERLLLELRRL